MTRGVTISADEEYKAWIVWKLMDHGPVVVAIDTSPERAEQHVALVGHEALALGVPKPETYVEETLLNHLYGQSISDIRSFGYAKAMERLKQKQKKRSGT